MCAMDREKVSALNAKAHIQTASSIKPARLKVVTGPPTLLEAFKAGEFAILTDEYYWKEVEEFVAEANNRFRRNRLRKKAAWIEAELAPTELEPRSDNEMYWFPVDVREDSEHLQLVQGQRWNEQDVSIDNDPRTCINCSANNQTPTVHTGVARTDRTAGFDIPGDENQGSPLSIGPSAAGSFGDSELSEP